MRAAAARARALCPPAVQERGPGRAGSPVSAARRRRPLAEAQGAGNALREAKSLCGRWPTRLRRARCVSCGRRAVQAARRGPGAVRDSCDRPHHLPQYLVLPRRGPLLRADRDVLAARAADGPARGPGARRPTCPAVLGVFPMPCSPPVSACGGHTCSLLPAWGRPPSKASPWSAAPEQPAGGRRPNPNPSRPGRPLAGTPGAAPRAQVTMHGLPIRPAFSEKRAPQPVLRKRLGMAQHLPAVLLVGARPALPGQLGEAPRRRLGGRAGRLCAAARG